MSPSDKNHLDKLAQALAELQETLHQRAQAQASEEREHLPPGQPLLTGEAQQRSMHELRVHQIQLEMQNQELRRIYAELDVVRARYVDLYDQAPAGYITLNQGGVIKQANLVSANLLGQTRHGLIGQPFTRFIVQEDQDCYYLLGRKLQAGAGLQGADLRLVGRQGEPFWAHLEVLSTTGESGKPELRLVISDISERRKVEQDLQAQKEFFHLIAENMADYIAVMDVQGRRLYNSPSYATFMGAQLDLNGSDSFAQVHPDDRERVKKVFFETVESGVGRQIEYRFVLQDGSVRDMRSRGSVIRNAQGQVERVVVVSHDITERRQLEDQLRQLAFFDPLTGLPNRRLLNDRLTRAMAASARSGLYGAVMFLDLDNFKPLNDTYGHATGDLLLVEAARRLLACVREVDTVSRFGGDEFVLMLTGLDTDQAVSETQALRVAEKVRAALSEPYHLTLHREGQGDAGLQHHCTASIGVTLFINHEARQGDILRWADRAMYLAKEAGRNNVHFYVHEEAGDSLAGGLPVF